MPSEPPRRLLLAFLGAALVAAILPTLASAAAPPAWSIDGMPYPSDFQPGAQGELKGGPGYILVATNVGGSTTSDEYTITDTLPAGVSATGEARVLEWLGYPAGSCQAEGGLVTCTLGQAIPPGQFVQVEFAVEVAAGASGALQDQASVEGGGATGSANATVPTAVGTGTPAFGPLAPNSDLSSFAADGSAATQAGSHPAQLEVSTSFPTIGERRAGEGFLVAGGHLRDFDLDLPRGAVVNPTASPVCREAELESYSCPLASAVGTVAVLTAITEGPYLESVPLYNMVAPPGAPAELAFNALRLGIYVHLQGGVRSDGEYQLSATSNDIIDRGLNPILGFQATLWGDPSSETFDSARGEHCLYYGGECPVERTGTAFLTQPSACSGPLGTTFSADSWESPGAFSTISVPTSDGRGNPVGFRGCSLLDFSPSITISPESRAADSPTGLKVDLHVPQDESYEHLAESNLKDARVVLPTGISVDPSSANGLGACSPSQVGLTTAVGQTPIRFTDEAAACPDDSKLGTVEVDTPLLEHPLPGAIYLASPHENPFGSLLAIYIAVYDPVNGVVIKLAGHVEADLGTGQLTATFEENPELPFEDFRLNFFGGPRAALRTPATCGSYESHSELAPWSGTATVQSSDSFGITSGPSRGACATSAAQQQNAPSFEAGTLTPLAGSYSPFVLRLKREDGSQEFGSIDATLPYGLLGRLTGIPYCSDAQLAAAAALPGRDEEASPSCPSASQVGTVRVGAGAGSQPYYVNGTAYLAGPYKGAPLSLAIVTPAVAGPYDLGTVVVRSALYVNQETAQISVKSDPIPRILEGIPLDIRSIAVEMDRPDFTLNPSSCEAMAVSGHEISTLGSVAPLSNRFQVGGCKGLPFAPKLALRVFGKTNRNVKPRFRAVLTTRPGEANIARAQVNLPHSEFLENAHLNQTCTRPVLLAGNCPATTIYGHAKAWTPLLEKPLVGPVYLVGGYGYKLPALVAELNGQIRILLVGKVDSGKNKGIRNTFEVVPDAPVSKFMLELKGGKKGILVNSEPLCSKKAKRHAIVRFVGQNGKVEQFKPKVAASCPGPKKKSGKGGKKK